MGLASLVVGRVLAASLLPLALGWAHLPDPVSINWGVDSDPDGSLALVAAPWLMVVLTLVALLTTPLFRMEGAPTLEGFAMVGLWVVSAPASWV